MRRCGNFVDLEKRWKMSIYLQKLVPLEQRTSPLKFGDLAETSEFDSISNPYTKVLIVASLSGKLLGAGQSRSDCFLCLQQTWNKTTNEA